MKNTTPYLYKQAIICLSYNIAMSRTCTTNVISKLYRTRKEVVSILRLFPEIYQRAWPWTTPQDTSQASHQTWTTFSNLPSGLLTSMGNMPTPFSKWKPLVHVYNYFIRVNIDYYFLIFFCLVWLNCFNKSPDHCNEITL